jgi:hypothetical protein
LPTELLCEVASYLPLEDLVSLRKTHNRAVVTKTCPEFAKSAFRDRNEWQRQWLCPSTINVLEQLASNSEFVPYITSLTFDILLLTCYFLRRGANAGYRKKMVRAFKKEQLKAADWTRLEDVLVKLTALRTLNIINSRTNDETRFSNPLKRKDVPGPPAVLTAWSKAVCHDLSDNTIALEDNLAARLLNAALSARTTHLQTISTCFPEPKTPIAIVPAKTLRKLVLIDFYYPNAIEPDLVPEFNRMLQHNKSLRVLHLTGPLRQCHKLEIPFSKLHWPQELEELQLSQVLLFGRMLGFFKNLPTSLHLLRIHATEVWEAYSDPREWFRELEENMGDRKHGIHLMGLTRALGIYLTRRAPVAVVPGVSHHYDAGKLYSIVNEECDGQDIAAWLRELSDSLQW